MSQQEQPAELKAAVSNNELKEISTPSVIYIMKSIKTIQKRMKDPDMAGLEYVRVYDTLAREFAEFSDKYTFIFTKVVRGENLNTLASILFYKDQVERGLITEEQLSELLAKKYLPAHLKEESDNRIREMKLSQ